MNNEAKYLDVFMKLFEIGEEEAKALKKRSISAWTQMILLILNPTRRGKRFFLRRNTAFPCHENRFCADIRATVCRRECCIFRSHRCRSAGV